MFYRALKKLVGIFFNVLNVLLAGNLPPLGCVCVIAENQGRYLAIERPEGIVVFPGGFMRWKERTIQTARREGKEETGLDLRIGEVIGYYSTPAACFDCISTLTIAHRAEVVGGTLRDSIEGHPCWLDEDALHRRLSDQYQQIFEGYLHHSQQHTEANASCL